MKRDELNKILAEEYGRLDKKYNMGYYPRPNGYEEFYKRGWGYIEIEKTKPGSSYSDKTNWGWH
jgi:hypothetical protein